MEEEEEEEEVGTVIEKGKGEERINEGKGGRVKADGGRKEKGWRKKGDKITMKEGNRESEGIEEI